MKLTVRSKISEAVYRSINDFKKGFQPRTNIVKDEKGNLITDSHRALGRWRNHFFVLEVELTIE